MKLRMLSESADIMTPLGKRPAERPGRWHNDWLREDWSNWEQWGHQFDPSTCELITRDGLRVYLGWEMPGTAAVIMGKLDKEMWVSTIQDMFQIERQFHKDRAERN